MPSLVLKSLGHTPHLSSVCQSPVPSSLGVSCVDAIHRVGSYLVTILNKLI